MFSLSAHLFAAARADALDEYPYRPLTMALCVAAMSSQISILHAYRNDGSMRASMINSPCVISRLLYPFNRWGELVDNRSNEAQFLICILVAAIIMKQSFKLF